MALYLNTKGRATLSVAICSRCAMKVAYDDLQPDGDKPGMHVCAGCNDKIDAWRLTPRATEDITIRYPRPDADISISAANVTTI